MGFFRKQVDKYNEVDYYFTVGCEILGPPAGGPFRMGTPLERAERVKAGKKEVERRKNERP